MMGSDLGVSIHVFALPPSMVRLRCHRLQRRPRQDRRRDRLPGDDRGRARGLSTEPALPRARGGGGGLAGPLPRRQEARGERRRARVHARPEVRRARADRRAPERRRLHRRARQPAHPGRPRGAPARERRDGGRAGSDQLAVRAGRGCAHPGGDRHRRARRDPGAARRQARRKARRRQRPDPRAARPS